jgi:hypothetical protein
MEMVAVTLGVAVTEGVILVEGVLSQAVDSNQTYTKCNGDDRGDLHGARAITIHNT